MGFKGVFLLWILRRLDRQILIRPGIKLNNRFCSGIYHKFS
jgi:hypothetical protein